jgi:hypothetical protein
MASDTSKGEDDIECKDDSGGHGSGGDSISVLPIYSKQDLDEVYDDAMLADIAETVRLDMDAIKKVAMDHFGSSDSMEFYEGGEWKPLDDINVLKAGSTVKVRVPSVYDSNDASAGASYGSESNSGAGMALSIHLLVDELKGGGYERADKYSMRSADGAVIPTKDWVLAAASEKQSLAELLLEQTGALRHIVECLHYDMLWREDEEGEGQRDANK